MAVVASMAFFAAGTTGVALVEIGLVLSGVGMGIASPSIAASVANVVDPGPRHGPRPQQLMVQFATVAGIQVVETVQESARRGQRGRPRCCRPSTPPSRWEGRWRCSVCSAPWCPLDTGARRPVALGI